MAWYLVSYDLRRELSPADWKIMHDALKTASDYCWPLQSVWIIQTALKPSEVISRLLNASIIDDNDGTFKHQVGKDRFSYHLWAVIPRIPALQLTKDCLAD